MSIAGNVTPKPATPKPATPAMEVSDFLNRVAVRAEQLGNRIEDTFGMVLKSPNPPVESPVCEAPTYPPFIQDLHGIASRLDSSLDYIESLIARSGV